MLINDSQLLAHMGGINSTRVYVFLCRLAPWQSPLKFWFTISRINVPSGILGAQRAQTFEISQSLPWFHDSTTVTVPLST